MSIASLSVSLVPKTNLLSMHGPVLLKVDVLTKLKLQVRTCKMNECQIYLPISNTFLIEQF